jgi:hypothetical protein
MILGSDDRKVRGVKPIPISIALQEVSVRKAGRISLALLGGFLISVIGPFLLIKFQIYSDTAWTILALGWVLFSVGSHDLVRMVFATIFDTCFYALMIYFLLLSVEAALRRMNARVS